MQEDQKKMLLDQAERNDIRSRVLMDGVHVATGRVEFCSSFLEVCAEILFEASKCKQSANESRGAVEKLRQANG